MRLARRALLLALATLTLCAAASAQTLRQENDPRNQAPTVGTGGSPGGPTGLFTIYDGDTLRRGEFTFSIAYSNYDRDPGNVDITEIPVSFQLGLGDHLEVFYNTDAYRGVKVNNPQNLSSFYLPNSQLFIAAPVITPSTNPLGGPSVVTLGPNRLQSGPAIVLAPTRVSGSVLLTNFPTLFRPAGNQTFVQFPFVGGAGPNFGLTGNRIAPPFTSRLGFTAAGGGGNFGGADLFPGIGSPYGSILPGVVLTTRVIPANLTFNTLVVPDLFTVAPVYLPDAPFVNRLYGESNFSTHTFGANIRLTEPDNALSVNIIPMYRWYWDKADDADGFNQLQRGASPGGSIGDFGLFGVVGGRLSRSVHLAANFGYFLNSNPRSEAFGSGDAVLLDRPDEFITGVGFDFPVNRHFQPMAELKSVWYVGGRTPNAFPNNPVDFLGGVRVFPRRWFGFTAWYRAHLNQQGERFLFGGDDEFPQGFEESDDPHGFGFQFFIGHRNIRTKDRVNLSATLTASTNSVVLPPAEPCQSGQYEGGCRPTDSRVTLTASTEYFVHPEHDPQKRRNLDKSNLRYTWLVERAGGAATGVSVPQSGSPEPTATIDFAGAPDGEYRVRVMVEEAGSETGECLNCDSPPVTITVRHCVCIVCPPIHATVRVTCPNEVYKSSLEENAPITFNSEVSGVPAGAETRYTWTVSAGTIDSGQGTSTIVVNTSGVEGAVTATLRVEVRARRSDGDWCEWVAFDSNPCTTQVIYRRVCRAFDSYEQLVFDNEKARLDNFAIQLQDEPTTAVGYYVTYGEPTGRTTAAQRAERALQYINQTRGLDASRVQHLVGTGETSCFSVILWICPAGTTPPLDASDPLVAAALSRVRCSPGK